MRVHQVLVTAAPGDAVTDAALELHRMMSPVLEATMYARYIHPALETEVESLEDFVGSPSPEADVLFFHASIGEPEVFEFLRDRPEQVVVNYHNISPAGAFFPYDPAFAGLLEGGRQEVAALAGRTTMALADSAYNAEELRAMGYADVRVVPLVTPLRRLLAEHPGPAAQRRIQSLSGRAVVLFVGQMLPHKRPDFLISAFHVLCTYLRPDAHLVVVGSQRLPRYAEGVRQLVSELNLDNVHLMGSVEGGELAGWYRRADLFVTASEHEGFCAPLLEAMAFGVPVVARRFAAVPETLGDAGLLVPPEAGPELAAEAMALLLGDQELRDEVVRRGPARVEALDPDRAGAAVIEHLRRLR
ncbi:MAG TPA: glycosyltransferase family 4 protein [Acidimicrobiales bacterium]|nr:glycosyltransferase family 4 protein [Acidimicrobiales bacterium]